MTSVVLLCPTASSSSSVSPGKWTVLTSYCISVNNLSILRVVIIEML